MLVQINEILEAVCWVVFIYVAVNLIQKLKVFNEFIDHLENENEQENQDLSQENAENIPPELANLLERIKESIGADFIEIVGVGPKYKKNAPRKTHLQTLQDKLKQHLENEEFEKAATIKKMIDSIEKQQ
jgi:excinuclease UvrABC helicase subunit UvrB